MSFLDRLFKLRRDRAASRASAWRRKWADPLGVRHWHNPADPVQAARIEAAAARREERAEKLRNDAQESYFRNVCHQHCSNVLALDTTYTY